MAATLEVFTLTEAHLKLLKRANVGWQDCETGAPEIDPKRPYGNSSVYLDVAEILDIKPAARCPKCGAECERCGDEGGGFSREERESLMLLHRGTEHALQIVLQHGHQLGRYRKGNWRDWVYLGPAE
jgi:hypothetical protein